MNSITKHSLEDLAAAANEAHAAAASAAVNVIEHARRAGAALIEARAFVPAGAWGAWLSGNFSGSHRTARRYMAVASNHGLTAGAGSVREAVRLLSASDDPLGRARPEATVHSDDPATWPKLPGGLPKAGRIALLMESGSGRVVGIVESPKHPGYFLLTVLDGKSRERFVRGVRGDAVGFALAKEAPWALDADIDTLDVPAFVNGHWSPWGSALFEDNDADRALDEEVFLVGRWLMYRESQGESMTAEDWKIMWIASRNGLDGSPLSDEEFERLGVVLERWKAAAT